MEIFLVIFGIEIMNIIQQWSSLKDKEEQQFGIKNIINLRLHSKICNNN
jgi:hypothetical protein